MGIDKDKFHGGVQYYHRHTEPGKAADPAMLDWDERQKFLRKRHRRRILKGLLALLLVLGLVAGTYVLMMPKG